MDHALQTPIVLADIGASGGIHKRWTRLTTKVNPLLFEPDPDEFARLSASVPAHYRVVQTALDSESTTRQLHLTRKRSCSSLAKPNQALIRKYPRPERLDVVAMLPVACRTLDSVVDSEGIARVDAIKLDTQGSELAILHGASQTLAKTISIEAEIEFAPIYENQPMFGDVQAHLTARGFELVTLTRTYWRRRTSFGYGAGGQLVDGDALFLKSPELVIASAREDPEMVLRAICIAFIYRQDNYAAALCDLLRQESWPPETVVHEAQRLVRKYFRRTMQERMPSFPGRRRLASLFGTCLRLFEEPSHVTGDGSV